MGKSVDVTVSPEPTLTPPSATSDGIQAERTAALDERLRPKLAADTVVLDAPVSKLAASQILALAVEGGGSSDEVIARATAYKKWIEDNDK